MAEKSSVLIVDDDARLRKTLSDVLGLKGYAVVTAATGQAALERVKKEAPVVALIDLKLDDIPGLEVLKEIKRRSGDTECIVLTGYASQESAIEAVNLGAYGYLQKPYDMEQLLLTIRRAVEKREAEEEKRESEQFNSTLLNGAPNPILVINPDTSIRYANAALENLTGFSCTEVLDMKAPYPWWTEETRDRTAQDLEEAMRRGARRLEELFQKKNGERFWVEISSTPVMRDGKMQYYLVNWLDVTDRKLVEERLRDSFINLAETVSRAMESHDPYTSNHQRRVAELVQLVGGKMGLGGDRLRTLHIGALLHDIGKISIPEGILTKPGALTEEEWALVRTHTQQGYDILKDSQLPRPVAEMALQHHEWLDGSGYPDGLRGDELSLELRILVPCNVAEAMSSHRLYRPARSTEETLAELRGERGRKYDPEVVDILLEVIEGGEFRLGGESR